ncbi:hypothetical protein PIB30_016662 [Stylosanthes scabra]|uniref:Disease resistance protein RPS4B/Roq1-like leucine-rich repeats domain-containing protein n=1 Tax=Stylosanthes scabra TaxID=79078 RepID=A0ABU6W7G4_9FABA|nr:hypothetical protein [Stylosanthes scabra]
MNAEDCSKLRSFPPTIKWPSLEDLHLSGCSSLENFPETPEEMKNLKMLILNGTGIKDLPCSFHNLSRLWHLGIRGDKMCKIPSVIGMMPGLSRCEIEGGGNKGKVSAKHAERLQGILVTHSLHSLNMSILSLTNGNLSDDFFPLAVAWFPNVKFLDLSGNNFTVIPECIQEFHSLLRLDVDDCKHLQEIRGVPPNLKTFSALNCKSWNPMATSVLVNQEVHQNRDTWFALPGRSIPGWFEHRSWGSSISFWFRGKFHSEALCLAILLKDDLRSSVWIEPILTINGRIFSDSFSRTKVDQLLILHPLTDSPFNEVSFENKWNYLEAKYKYNPNCRMASIAEEIGINISKKNSIIEDIRYSDPYRRTKLMRR